MHQTDEFVVIAGCPDGDCPKVKRHPHTGAIRVRGADPLNPGEERDVDFTAQEWSDLMAELR